MDNTGRDWTGLDKDWPTLDEIGRDWTRLEKKQVLINLILTLLWYNSFK